MTVPLPQHRATWRLAAGLAALALAVATVHALGGSAAAEPGHAGAPVASSAETPPQTAQPTSSADPGRALRFRGRVADFLRVQGVLERAFHPVAALTRRVLEGPGARVAPGRTPEACLAQAVYYEARGEPARGQAAVAQVVLNRARSGDHPSAVCGVVFEGADRAGCQFSFACDRRLGERRVEPAAWEQARSVARAALAGQEAVELRTAVNYHADYVRPRWADRLQRTAEIGRHIFYGPGGAPAPDPATSPVGLHAAE